MSDGLVRAVNRFVFGVMGASREAESEPWSPPAAQVHFAGRAVERLVMLVFYEFVVIVVLLTLLFGFVGVFIVK